MGSPANEPGRYDTEGPQHDVTVKAFALGKYNVTVEEFLLFLKQTGYRPEPCNPILNLGWKSPGGGLAYPPFVGQPPRWPASCLDWRDAQAYVEWLNKKVRETRPELGNREGPYRLPSEAEWEFAARGGVDGALFVWGDTVDGIRSPKAANVADDTVRPHYPWWAVFPNYRDGFSWTAPAGSFAANGFGLFDMAGNVWEWTADWYAPTAYSSSPAMDPRGPASGRSRVVRGSSWGDEPLVLRISERSYQSPEHRSYFHGFRCARDEPPS